MMRQTLERLGWNFIGTCGCDGGGEKFGKDGKNYYLKTFLRSNKFQIIKYDQVKKTGHGYDLETIITEYEAAN